MEVRTDGFTHREIIDPTGEKVGKVTDVLYDDAGLGPAWLVVKPGLFKSEHYVPAQGASLDGDDLVVIRYDAETVRSSPKATSDHTLSTAARSMLRDHYQLADA